MTKHEALNLVMAELESAENKFPDWPEDIIHTAAIVSEEAGELVQACNNKFFFGGGEQECIDEAVQTAAMAIRFLINR